MEKCPDLCSSESSLELIQTLPHVFVGQSTCVKGEYGLVRVQEKIKIKKKIRKHLLLKVKGIDITEGIQNKP